MLYFAQLVNTKKSATEFGREKINFFLIKRSKFFQNVDIFVVCLGKNASYDKIRVVPFLCRKQFNICFHKDVLPVKIKKNTTKESELIQKFFHINMHKLLPFLVSALLDWEFYLHC